MALSSGSREGGGHRYALFAEIGSSETASVHVGQLADASGVARTVTIYKLYPRFARDPEFLTTFLDETRIAARVRHPNIVPTLDIVRDSFEVLVVMESVAGESLAQLGDAVRASGQRLDPLVVCAVLVGALHGLHAAHEAKNEFSEPLGLVHGGVSPKSIWVGVDGVARLVDFGVAKALGAMRAAGRPPIQGNLPYMAPEQLRGATVTRATDVWAAAVVLWEALAGEPLFRADDDATLARAVLETPIRNPGEFSPGLPPALDAVVQRGLDRDPKRRFATAREMASAIAEASPSARPSEVGACVQRECGDAIARRAETIRAIKSTPRKGAPFDAPIVPSGEFIADALWGEHGKSAPPTPVLPPSPPNDDPQPAEVAQVRARPLPARDARASALRRWSSFAAALAVLGLLASGAALLSIPWYAKQRAIASAAARGVSVTIDDATGGFGSVTFHGVAASVLDVPGARATISELEIELRGLRPETATLRHAEVSLDGPFFKTLALATRWYGGHDGAPRTTAEGGDDGMRVVVPSAHVLWSHAFGEDGEIEAGEVSGDLVAMAGARVGDAFQFTTSKLTLRSKAGTMGPWRIDLEQARDALNARIAFDPPVPDGPGAMITRMATGKTSVEVNIPRSPLYRIGIPPAILADLRQVPDQGEGKLHYARTPDDHVDASFTATLFGLHAPPFTGPVDVKVAGSLAGSASGPLDLQGGVLAVGPVRATLAGPVVIDDGVRATLTWKVAPIPCAQLLPKSDRAATDLADRLGTLGADGGDLASLGIDVTALAQSAGFARVSGNLSASGTLVFDSSDLSGTTFAATGKNSCGISLFAGR